MPHPSLPRPGDRVQVVALNDPRDVEWLGDIIGNEYDVVENDDGTYVLDPEMQGRVFWIDDPDKGYLYLEPGEWAWVRKSDPAAKYVTYLYTRDDLIAEWENAQSVWRAVRDIFDIFAARHISPDDSIAISVVDGIIMGTKVCLEMLTATTGPAADEAVA